MSNLQNADGNASTNKKLLENSVFGGIMVPIAIVLVGAFIVFGVTKLISTDRSHKDLVREMRSKTFGNRWIAAYELSKLISTSQIPKEDHSWLVGNLNALFKESQDPRTKDFIVVALDALRTPESVETLYLGLNEADSNIKFHSLIALGNLPKGTSVRWDEVMKFLGAEDKALYQAAILALGTHGVLEAQSKIVEALKSDIRAIRIAAASVLINYKDERALPNLKEALLRGPREDLENPSRPEDPVNLADRETLGVKLSIINAMGKNEWQSAIPLLELVVKNEKNLKILSKAREVLIQLKN